jgi:hypothetical protein
MRALQLIAFLRGFRHSIRYVCDCFFRTPTSHLILPRTQTGVMYNQYNICWSCPANGAFMLSARLWLADRLTSRLLRLPLSHAGSVSLSTLGIAAFLSGACSRSLTFRALLTTVAYT